jgi:hypothetical protein
VAYPVLEFREEKQTFAKVKGGNVDFFLSSEEKIVASSLSLFAKNPRNNIKRAICILLLIKATGSLLL